MPDAPKSYPHFTKKQEIREGLQCRGSYPTLARALANAARYELAGFTELATAEHDGQDGPFTLWSAPKVRTPMSTSLATAEEAEER